MGQRRNKPSFCSVTNPPGTDTQVKLCLKAAFDGISGTAVNNQLTVITHGILWRRRGEGKAMHAGLTADGVADLLGHVSDLVNRIRQEVVCFQEVKGADRQQLKGDAHVSAQIEPVQHLHAVADGRRAHEVDRAKAGREERTLADSLLPVWILLPDPFQHIYLQFGCFSVFLQVLNDLQSNSSSSSERENAV